MPLATEYHRVAPFEVCCGTSESKAASSAGVQKCAMTSVKGECGRWGWARKWRHNDATLRRERSGRRRELFVFVWDGMKESPLLFFL